MTEVGDLKVFANTDAATYWNGRRPSVREALIFSAVTAGLLYAVWGILI
jgi:hypothetical protein